ncbi:hypothetical protein ACVR1G_01510 [Streptococcus dentasini]
MKKKLAISILLVAILLGAISMTALVMRNNKQSSHSAPPSSSSHKQESYEKTIELDQVYKESDTYATYYRVLKSDGTYIVVQDRANIYRTQADLDKAGNEEEMAVTPSIHYRTGTYKINGNDIKYTSNSSTAIYFSTVANVKDGKYYSIEQQNHNSNTVWTKKKNGYNTKENVVLKLYKSDYSIPNTEEEFLEQYTYDPSTKDDR